MYWFSMESPLTTMSCFVTVRRVNKSRNKVIIWQKCKSGSKWPFKSLKKSLTAKSSLIYDSLTLSFLLADAIDRDIDRDIDICFTQWLYSTQLYFPQVSQLTKTSCVKHTVFKYTYSNAGATSSATGSNEKKHDEHTTWYNKDKRIKPSISARGCKQRAKLTSFQGAVESFG